MAYNVLKGSVDGSVDQHGDQEIEGVKIFKSTISASVFYDTDSQSPCATMKDVAITKINKHAKNSILVYDGGTTATGHYNLTFDGQMLETKKIVAEKISGNGSGLTQLPPNKFTGPIEAQFLSLGSGLMNKRGNLHVKTGPGLVTEAGSVTISISPDSGLTFKDKKLNIDPTKVQDIRESGQNLSDVDVLLVADVSSGKTRGTNLQNFYESYIKIKNPQPAGSTTEVQLKGNTGFDATSNLSYNTKTDELNVDGKINTKQIKITGNLKCEGSVFGNIKKITCEKYEVESHDYTILCDAEKAPISVIVPPACDNVGRIITIKKVNTDKYNLRSYPVTIISDPTETIDFKESITIKMNYSSCTLQSDGENWWVIGSRGS